MIDNTIGDNAKIIVLSNMNGSSIIHYAYNDDGLFKYSTDFLHIRSHNGDTMIVNYYNQNKDRDVTKYIDEEVVSFISSFTNGSVHGYAAVWIFILHYLKNNLTHMVLLSTKTQDGIRQLVAHCIGEDKIITLDTHEVYQFRRIHFIPVTEMHFSDTFWKKNNPSFVKLLINPRFDNEGKSNLCLMKVNSATTGIGIIPLDQAKTFCHKNNLYLLRPFEHNEIETANLLWNCESVVFSWGTTYYKNLRYIGDKCRNIYVIITPGFIHQEYHPRKNRPDSHTYKRYRNADVKYLTYISNISELSIEYIEEHGTIHKQNEYIDVNIVE